MAVLQIVRRTALRPGNTTSSSFSVTYGHKAGSRLRRATNAWAGSTFILVRPSTFYVTESDLFEAGDGLAGCPFRNPAVACGRLGDRLPRPFGSAPLAGSDWTTAVWPREMASSNACSDGAWVPAYRDFTTMFWKRTLPWSPCSIRGPGLAVPWTTGAIVPRRVSRSVPGRACRFEKRRHAGVLPADGNR